MPELHITGWRYGLEKVSMTRIINSELSLGLKPSKACTDKVLEGETVILDVDDLLKAEELALHLNAIGANVEVHN